MNGDTIGRDATTWMPRIELILGKIGFEQIGAANLYQRIKNASPKRVKLHAVEGWVGIVLDGAGEEKLGVLTKGADNWLALEHPKPFVTVLHVKTEDADVPKSASIDTTMLLNLCGGPAVDELTAFTWYEPRDGKWAVDAIKTLHEIRTQQGAEKDNGRQVSVQSVK